MEVRIRVKPGAKKESVSPLPDGRLEVSVKARPVGGRANQRILELVAEHFNVSVSQVHIAKGRTSRTKTVSVAT
ncbi:MAG: DUF167 domain-containing protein [Patescibacteria group bacterium]